MIDIKQEIEAQIDEIVELNVGGEHITTARSTLCSVEGSMLEAMFSGTSSVSFLHAHMLSLISILVSFK